MLAVLDKIFCTTHFEQKFSMIFVTTSSRAGSEHVPLVLNLDTEEIKKNQPSLGLKNGGLSNLSLEI